jgi:hypothetical protein
MKNLNRQFWQLVWLDSYKMIFEKLNEKFSGLLTENLLSCLFCVPENFDNLWEIFKKNAEFLYTRVKWTVQLECKGESIIVGVVEKKFCPLTTN